MAETGIEPASFDAVISVSSIEHNSWDHILRIVDHLADLLKPGAPLFFTVPAGEKRAWYPGGEFPGHKQFPQVYLFDAEAFREIELVLQHRGQLTVPLLSDTEYRKQWKEMKKDQESFPGGHVMPYLSAGFAFIRNNEPA